MHRKSANINLPKHITEELASVNVLNNLYLGIVRENTDPTFMGRIFVHIPALAAPTNVVEDKTDRKEDGIRPLILVTPFGGNTDPLQASQDPTIYGEDNTSENGTPKSYGMWPQPPALGSIVLCAYSPSAQQAFYIGTVIDYDRNQMMGGRPSGKAYLGGAIKLAPTGEKNPNDEGPIRARPGDPEFYDILVEQGLIEDLVRGHSNSSPRRETPSRVFGLTTNEGHYITMDDGDENGDSKNIRVRTKNGAQILMDDSTKIIFINNHDGSSWIEMDGDGNIDIYAKGKISMHTEDDFNVHAKGDINLQADKNINMKSVGSQGIRVETTVGDIDFRSARHYRLQADLTTNIKSSHHIETAGRIDMNGPTAASALKPFLHNLPGNRNVTVSIATRVPEHHPWEGVNAKQTDWTDARGKNAK